jgi:hypothetical protein
MSTTFVRRVIQVLEFPKMDGELMGGRVRRTTLTLRRTRKVMDTCILEQVTKENNIVTVDNIW